MVRRQKAALSSVPCLAALQRLQLLMGEGGGSRYWSLPLAPRRG